MQWVVRVDSPPPLVDWPVQQSSHLSLSSQHFAIVTSNNHNTITTSLQFNALVTSETVEPIEKRARDEASRFRELLSLRDRLSHLPQSPFPS